MRTTALLGADSGRRAVSAVGRSGPSSSRLGDPRSSADRAPCLGLLPVLMVAAAAATAAPGTAAGRCCLG